MPECAWDDRTERVPRQKSSRPLARALGPEPDREFERIKRYLDTLMATGPQTSEATP